MIDESSLPEWAQVLVREQVAKFRAEVRARGVQARRRVKFAMVGFSVLLVAGAAGVIAGWQFVSSFTLTCAAATAVFGYVEQMQARRSEEYEALWSASDARKANNNSHDGGK